jgi:hypothetical protein
MLLEYVAENYSSMILFHQQSHAKRIPVLPFEELVAGPVEDWTKALLVPLFAAAVTHLAAKAGVHEADKLTSTPSHTHAPTLPPNTDWLAWLVDMTLVQLAPLSNAFDPDIIDSTADVGALLWDDAEGTAGKLWQHWQTKHPNICSHQKSLFLRKLKLAFARKGLMKDGSSLAVGNRVLQSNH